MRDPLSVSPTILPQLDLTSLANQEGQIKYNIAEQGIEKQKKTDAYISGIADKINIKGKEWASKFGKLNLDAVNGLKGEYLSLIHKYKDYNAATDYGQGQAVGGLVLQDTSGSTLRADW